jgi:hypothetical protein
MKYSIFQLKGQRIGIPHQRLKYQHGELFKVIKTSSPLERASNFGLEMTFDM